MSPISTDELDEGDDSPKLARASLLLSVQAVNKLFTILDPDTDSNKLLVGRTTDFSSDVNVAGLINGNVVGNVTGNVSGTADLANAAVRLQTGRTISMTGDGVWTSGAFDGSTNVTGALTLATVNTSPGGFGGADKTLQATVNGKGLVTVLSQVAIAIAASAVASGTFADARIAQSNVTQHQASLTILESQITDSTVLARNAGNETITGSWTFNISPLVPAPSGSSAATPKTYVDGAITSALATFQTDLAAQFVAKTGDQMSGQLRIGNADVNGNLLEVSGNGPSAGGLFMRYSNDASGPLLYLNKTRSSSVNGRTLVQSGDTIGAIVFNGADGTNLQQAARISAIVDAAASGGIIPTRLSFYTSPSVSGGSVESMRLSSAGGLGVGTTTPGTTLGFGDSTAANTVFEGFRSGGPALISAIAESSNAFVTATSVSSVAANNAGALRTIRARGTLASKAAVQAGDLLGALQTYGFDGTSALAGTWINSTVDTMTGTNNMSSYMSFGTRNDGTASPVTERMRLDKTGTLMLSSLGYFSPVVVGGIASGLQLSATDGQCNISTIRYSTTTANSANLAFSKVASVTPGTFTAVVTGDNLGAIKFNGADGTAITEGARIFAAVNGTVSNGTVPTDLIFTTTQVERMRINATGGVGIGRTAAAGTQLDVQVAASGTGLRITGGESGNGIRILNSTAGSAINISAMPGTAQGGLISTDGGGLTIQTSGASHAYVDTSGNFITGALDSASGASASFGHGGTVISNRVHNGGTTINSQAQYFVSSSAVVANSAIGGLSWVIPTVSTGATGMMGYIGMTTDSTFTTSTPAAGLVFATRTSGSAAASEKMRLDSDGKLGLGAPSGGMRMYVTSGLVGGVSIGIDNTNAAGYSSLRLGNGNTAETGSGCALHYMNSSYVAGNPYFPNSATLTSWGVNGLNLNAGNAAPATAMIRLHHNDVMTSQFTANGAKISNSMVGYSFLSANAANTAYYLIGTLPASTAGTYDQMTIICNLTDSWVSSSNRLMKVSLANRDGFLGRTLSIEGGVPTPAAKIVAYTQSNGTTQVYVAMTNGYYATMALDVRISQQVTLNAYPVSSTTVPSGTLAYDSSTANVNTITDGTGCTLLNTTTNSTNARLAISYARASSQGITIKTDADSGGGSAMIFQNAAGTAVGSVWTSASATAYATSSDYRLKNITGDLVSSGEFIDALKPKVGTWKVDGSPFVGFLAHELQEVCPGAVIGEKDATNEQTQEPIYQAIDASSPEMIANMVAELQSLRRRNAALETDVSELKTQMAQVLAQLAQG